MYRETPALELREANGPFTLIEIIKVEILKSPHVLMEIHAVGLCHTDLPPATGVLPAVTPAAFDDAGKHSSQSCLNSSLKVSFGCWSKGERALR